MSLSKKQRPLRIKQHLVLYVVVTLAFAQSHRALIGSDLASYGELLLVAMNAHWGPLIGFIEPYAVFDGSLWPGAVMGGVVWISACAIVVTRTQDWRAHCLLDCGLFLWSFLGHVRYLP